MLGLGLVATTAVLLPAEFPEPEALAPNVAFWERVYATWDSGQAIIHDREYLDVVYEVVDLGEYRLHPRPKDPAKWRLAVRKRREIIGRRLDAIRAALESLEARRRRGTLDPEALDGLQRRIYRAIRHEPELLDGAASRLRWQYGLADRFAEGFDRFDAWKDALAGVFREEGIPEDLLALAFVESLFDPHAESHVGAHGLFQFMPATARELGLKRTRLYDQRRDPLHAARALARMLRRSYERLGNWPLALTAHNHGPNGVARAVEQVGSRDLVTLIQRYRSPTWGFASKNFYAEFLAARRVLRRRGELFGDFVPVPPFRLQTVRLPGPTRLSDLEAAGCVNRSDVVPLNPALTTLVTDRDRPLPRAYPLNLPADLDLQAFLQCAADAALTRPPRPTRAVAATTRAYRVRPGDTLSAIGRRFRVSIDTLIAINDLDPDGFIRAGQILRIPGRKAVRRGRGKAQPRR